MKVRLLPMYPSVTDRHLLYIQNSMDSIRQDVRQIILPQKIDLLAILEHHDPSLSGRLYQETFFNLLVAQGLALDATRRSYLIKRFSDYQHNVDYPRYGMSILPFHQPSQMK